MMHTDDDTPVNYKMTDLPTSLSSIEHHGSQ